MSNDAYVSKWNFFKSMEYLKDEIVNGIKNHDQADWTDEENETLIDFYRENEFLWNHYLNDYKNRDKGELAWLFPKSRNSWQLDHFKIINHNGIPLKQYLKRRVNALKGVNGLEVEQTLFLFQSGSSLTLVSLQSNAKMWMNL